MPGLVGDSRHMRGHVVNVQPVITPRILCRRYKVDYITVPIISELIKGWGGLEIIKLTIYFPKSASLLTGRQAGPGIWLAIKCGK